MIPTRWLVAYNLKECVGVGLVSVVFVVRFAGVGSCTHAQASFAKAQMELQLMPRHSTAEGTPTEVEGVIVTIRWHEGASGAWASTVYPHDLY